ncbi:MAG: AI-2E family transporter [Blastocatellia bacterium]
MSQDLLNGYKLTIEKAFLLVLIAFIGYLLVSLLYPFSTAILWAFTLAIVLQPWQKWLNKKISNKTVVALIGVATAVTVIIVPLVFVSFQVTKEIKIIYRYFQNPQNVDALVELAKDNKVLIWLEENAGVSTNDIKESLSEKISTILNFALQYVTKIISNSFSLIINFIFTLFTLFFLLRDGDKFLHWLLKLLPISNEKKLELVERVKLVINATLFGNVIVAITQASLAGFMFYLLGVPAVLIWTVIMAILAMIPMVGTAFIWVPTAIWLFLTGSIAKAIILVVWGIFVVGLIDNILRPMLVGRQTNLPTIVTFYSVLGGIRIFGPLGLVLGPLIVASFVTLLNFIFPNNEEIKLTTTQEINQTTQPDELKEVTENHQVENLQINKDKESETDKTASTVTD